MQSTYPASQSPAISPGFHFSTAWLSCLETPSGRSCSPTAFLESPVQAAWCSFHCSEVRWTSWQLPSWRALFRCALSSLNPHELSCLNETRFQAGTHCLGYGTKATGWSHLCFPELITAVTRPSNLSSSVTASKEAVDSTSPELSTHCLFDFPEIWVHILQPRPWCHLDCKLGIAVVDSHRVKPLFLASGMWKSQSW